MSWKVWATFSKWFSGINNKRLQMEQEIKWDKLLKIKTTGRDDSKADCFRYPYEPTPYCVLERLANSGYIDKNTVLLDYGCGKGRVDFYLSYQTKCKSIGVEYDDRIYKSAVANCEVAVSRNRTSFVNVNAEMYEVPEEVNSFYFFNPFSVEILGKVVARIIDSYYASPREMKLFFYYISCEYISYLMNVDELSFADEIECGDLFDGEEREKIMIFTIG